MSLINAASGTETGNYGYDEYGKSKYSNSSSNNPYRYSGEYFDDETGFYYLKSRYYSPDMRRFTSEDTYKGDINNPATLNYYMYCNGNPLKYIDPTGHMYGLPDGTDYGSVYKPDGNGNTVIGGKSHFKSDSHNTYKIIGNIRMNQEMINTMNYENGGTDFNPLRDGLMVGFSFIGVTELGALATGATGTAGVSTGTVAVLNNGYYEVNGFKFSKYYYEYLWKTGRGAPSLVAKEILETATKVVPDATKTGFFKYFAGKWYIILKRKRYGICSR